MLKKIDRKIIDLDHLTGIGSDVADDRTVDPCVVHGIHQPRNGTVRAGYVPAGGGVDRELGYGAGGQGIGDNVGMKIHDGGHDSLLRIKLGE